MRGRDRPAGLTPTRNLSAAVDREDDFVGDQLPGPAKSSVQRWMSAHAILHLGRRMTFGSHHPTRCLLARPALACDSAAGGYHGFRKGRAQTLQAAHGAWGRAAAAEKRRRTRLLCRPAPVNRKNRARNQARGPGREEYDRRRDVGGGPHPADRDARENAGEERRIVQTTGRARRVDPGRGNRIDRDAERRPLEREDLGPVSYTHLRAHETVLDLVCRLLLEKK